LFSFACRSNRNNGRWQCRRRRQNRCFTGGGGGGGTTGKTTDKDVPVPSRKLIRRGIVIGDCRVFSCLTCTYLFNLYNKNIEGICVRAQNVLMVVVRNHREILIAYRSLGVDGNLGFVRQFAFLATFNRILLLSTGHSRERCSGGRNG
jgi:hypothetical protein